MKVKVSDIELFIFDLDGVVYKGTKPILFAVEAIKKYKDLDKKIVFFTNNSTQTRESYQKKLTSFGISCSEKQIYTSSFIAASVLASKCPGCSVFINGEEGFIQTFNNAGFNIINRKYDPDFIIKHDNIKCDLVVSGLDRNFTYSKLAACTQLINRGASFYATNDDATLPDEYGFLPGAGALLASLITATNKKPLATFGKPAPEGIYQIIKDFGVTKGKTIIIGDKLETDILCAKNAGIRSALVLTGVAGQSNVKKNKKCLMPDLILNNLSEL